MQRILSGTAETRTQHNRSLAFAGAAFSVLVPMAIGVVGLAIHGFAAINWLAAIVWGLCATLAFNLIVMVGKRAGMTRIDIADLFGSLFAAPGSPRSRRIGGTVHFINGAILAVGWAYFDRLAHLPLNWATGVLWGVILWGCAELMLSTLGGWHPAMRRGAQEDPGPFALHFGRGTPVGALLAHVVYGLILGLLYQATV